MGHHIDAEGRFQSDKYPWLPPDMILLSTVDGAAKCALMAWGIYNAELGVKVLLDFNRIGHHGPLRRYAQLTVDRELAEDILARLESLGREA